MGDGPVEPVTSEPPRHLTADLLASLEKTYSTGRRQIWRWWKEGAPLWDPAAMPSWWATHKKWAVPDKIQKAAADHAPVAEPISAPGVSPVAPVAFTGVKSEESVILGNFALGEGEAVIMQRRLVAATYEKLKMAYETGVSIDLLQKRYNGAAEALRKLEASDRIAQKDRGNLLPRHVLQSEIGTALELLRQTRESMERKVVELCPWLMGDQRQQVIDAIRTVRMQEDHLFRNLKSLKSPADVADRLAA